MWEKEEVKYHLPVDKVNSFQILIIEVVILEEEEKLLIVEIGNRK